MKSAQDQSVYLKFVVFEMFQMYAIDRNIAPTPYTTYQ